MKYQVFSHSKHRDGRTPGDDAVLCIPGVLAAVLDGATDPLGGQKIGKSPGQFAANTVGQACAELFLDPKNLGLSAQDIVNHLSQKLRAGVETLDFKSLPTTTLALALFLPDAVRFLAIGDSGIRVNGDKVLVFHKLIDDVSTASRVAVFALLRTRISDLDQVEYTCRDTAFRGLANAVAEGVLTWSESDGIIAKVQNQFADFAIHDDIADFLAKGIVSQSSYANRTNHPLGFSALNGVTPSMEDVIDVTIAKAEIRSIELFSDGYSNLPKGQSIAEWESAHLEAETQDFHSIGPFKTVKGATGTEFFDDRSVISIQM